MVETYDCDILLYRGTSLISKAIQLFDGTDVSHAGLYIADATVAEALGSGLTRRDVGESTAGAEWVLVRRLKDALSEMTPVRDLALAYVDQGNRYAYEQIVLLAFLCLTRKVRVTPILRLLVRKALDTAASFVAGLASGSKQPMICSEFVYRAYDEAVAGIEDPYSLELHAWSRSRAEAVRAGLPASARGLPPSLLGHGIHRGSLLDWAVSPGARAWSDTYERPSEMAPADTEAHELVARAAPDASPAASTPELDTVIERYLEEVRAPPGARRLARDRDVESVPDEQLREAVERFAVTFYANAQIGIGDKEPTALRAPVDISEASEFLLKSAADFVTPGDLLNARNLYTLGQLN